MGGLHAHQSAGSSGSGRNGELNALVAIQLVDASSGDEV